MGRIGDNEKQYVDRLERLALNLEISIDKKEYLHYEPDQVWKSSKGTIGFEVEVSASNKKVIGDAFLLSKHFCIGFIILTKRFEARKTVLCHFGFNKVHIINADTMEDEIKKILKDQGFIN
jgi:hypothetical protein